jgi:UDP-N-acetylmuramoyl-tripeptide--D-alanyl-D-alanine ligase
MHTVEAVARENGSVFASLPADGVAVFPVSDAYTGLWQTLAQGRRTLTFGEGGDVVCRRAAWEQGAWAVTAATPQGEFNTRLHIAGRHNVINALAAAACALAAGAPLAAIAQGLQDFVPVKGRSRAFSLRTAGREITVVDDTYNANPDSMRAAIDVLAELPGPQLLVLGDMGEVGDQGPQFHAEAGAHAVGPCRRGLWPKPGPRRRRCPAFQRYARTAGCGARSPARCGQRAGQGIPIHEDGTGRGGDGCRGGR